MDIELVKESDNSEEKLPEVNTQSDSQFGQEPDIEHEGIASLLDVISEGLNQKGYTYFIVAGKDGTMSRFIRGNKADLTEMFRTTLEKHPEITDSFLNALGD